MNPLPTPLPLFLKGVKTKLNGLPVNLGTMDNKLHNHVTMSLLISKFLETQKTQKLSPMQKFGLSLFWASELDKE
jgi:hypothetical protein